MKQSWWKFWGKKKTPAAWMMAYSSPPVQMYQGDELIYDSTQSDQPWREFLAQHPGRDSFRIGLLAKKRCFRIEFTDTYATETDSTVKPKLDDTPSKDS